MVSICMCHVFQVGHARVSTKHTEAECSLGVKPICIMKWRKAEVQIFKSPSHSGSATFWKHHDPVIYQYEVPQLGADSLLPFVKCYCQ